MFRIPLPATPDLSGESHPDLIAEALQVIDLLADDDFAACVGQWGDYCALIAPHAVLQPCEPSEAWNHSSTTGSGTESDADPIRFSFQAYPDRCVESQVPQAATALATDVWLLDHEGQWWSTAVEVDAAAHVIQQARAATHRGASAPSSVQLDWDAGNRDAHREGVESCLDAIRAGEVYQCCISTQFQAHSPLQAATPPWRQAYQWWRTKVATTRPHFAAFMRTDDVAITSLSPELFLRRRPDAIDPAASTDPATRTSTVYESPIKGTLPIADDPEVLRRSTKDRAENIMIVDLVRHDLGQVAITGSVTVPELLHVEAAPGVWHLVSTVSAKLSESVTNDQLVAACFPPASVTGTPKIRARQLLQHWEPVPRGIHCGAIGVVFADELISSVAIRTAQWHKDGTVKLGTGGGITIDSLVDAEWDEIQAKISTLR